MIIVTPVIGLVICGLTKRLNHSLANRLSTLTYADEPRSREAARLQVGQ